MSSHKIKKPTAVAVAIDCACFGFFTQSHADGVLNAITSQYPGSYKGQLEHRVTLIALPPVLEPLYLSG
jgi:hypothetical protein